MDCPKKDCDGQIEAWYSGTAFADVDETELLEGEGEKDHKPILAGYGEDWEFTEFKCSQCGATWINKQQLLAEKGERVLEESKGGDIKKHMWD